MPHPPATRLAPSPTGALHLGNARTFLVNWAMARQRGWRVVLRVEDLDTPRVKKGAAEQAIEDLRWLGLDWDEGPYFQLADQGPYRAALQTLSRKGLVYPCACTRSEIERAQSAPHGDEHELRYPGTCRGGAGRLSGPHHAVRVMVPDEEIVFTDEIRGEQRVNVQAQVGDFIVATKAGLPAYQLAVVVDDARQGVTDVVRGDDLLRSTARQVLLYRLLDLAAPGVPRYWHLPLVVGPDGRRLAKRHGDSRIAGYRDAGVPLERIIGLLARWSGVTTERTTMTIDEFRDAFDCRKMPRNPTVFTSEDHAWLTAG